MKHYSLTKTILGSHYLGEGVISHVDGSISKGFEMEPLPSGVLEEGFEGGASEGFFSKLSDLLSKLPNLFEGQIILSRSLLNNSELGGFVTRIFCFEKVKNKNSYSHLQAVLSEVSLESKFLSLASWNSLLAGVFTDSILQNRLPDITWERDFVKLGEEVVRVLSLTELPQITWRGCLQPIFENGDDFTLSFHLSIPERAKIKRQLETKRRVSHALSITSSLEVKNIESNSVLSSSEETLACW